jgi:hypothetical protein
MRWLLPAIVCSLAIACGGDSPDPEPAATAPATDTPAATATAVPPTPVIPPGWQVVTVEAIEFALPSSYVGGSLDDPATLDAIRALGGGCVGVANLVESSGVRLAFFSVDREGCATSIRNAQVISVAADENITSRQFLNDFLPAVTPPNARVLNSREGTINGVDAAFATIHADYGTYVGTQRMYAIRVGDRWYMLTAAAPLADENAAAPIFDQIASTLHVR